MVHVNMVNTVTSGLKSNYIKLCPDLGRYTGLVHYTLGQVVQVQALVGVNMYMLWTKRERGQYPAILTGQAWSIKNL